MFLFEKANNHPEYALSISAEKSESGTLRMRHMVASFTVQVTRHAPALERMVLYDAWEAEVARLNAQAPPTAQHAVQSAGEMWEMMAVQQLLLFYAKACILALSIVGFVIILLATGSLRLAAISAVVPLASG